MHLYVHSRVTDWYGHTIDVVLPCWPTFETRYIDTCTNSDHTSLGNGSKIPSHSCTVQEI